MDQKKIGGFISILRKDKGFTQEELGAYLGVTNKTVSRWETGKYMPDIALIPEVCRLLDVTVNELLYGERMEDDSFRKQADATILDILEKDSRLRRQKQLSEMLGGAGTGLILSALYSPSNTSKAVVAVVGTMMILCGWYYRSKLENTIVTVNVNRKNIGL